MAVGPVTVAVDGSEESLAAVEWAAMTACLHDVAADRGRVGAPTAHLRRRHVRANGCQRAARDGRAGA
jgi:hypothetical protein